MAADTESVGSTEVCISFLCQDLLGGDLLDFPRKCPVFITSPLDITSSLNVGPCQSFLVIAHPWR
jgi:hypothetical protein